MATPINSGETLSKESEGIPVASPEAMGENNVPVRTPEAQAEKAEREKQESSERAEDAKQAEERLEKEEDAPARPAFQENVADLIQEKPEAQKTLIDRIKDFSANNPIVGTAVRAWISVQRTIMSIFPPPDAAAKEQQLASIEKLYGKFFGGGEMRGTVNAYLEKQYPQMKTIAGLGDGGAYARLHLEYQQTINQKAKDMNVEDIAAVAAGYPIDTFLQERIDDYVQGQKLEAGTQYRTTLLGIADRKKAVEAPPDHTS